MDDASSASPSSNSQDWEHGAEVRGGVLGRVRYDPLPSGATNTPSADVPYNWQRHDRPSSPSPDYRRGLQSGGGILAEGGCGVSIGLGLLHQRVLTTPPGCPWVDAPTTASLDTLATQARRPPTVPCPGAYVWVSGIGAFGGGVDRPTHYQTQVAAEALAAAGEPSRRQRAVEANAAFAGGHRRDRPRYSAESEGGGWRQRRVTPCVARGRRVREDRSQARAGGAIWHAERAGEAGMDSLDTASHGRWDLVEMPPRMRASISIHMRTRAS